MQNLAKSKKGYASLLGNDAGLSVFGDILAKDSFGLIVYNIHTSLKAPACGCFVAVKFAYLKSWARFSNIKCPTAKADGKTSKKTIKRLIYVWSQKIKHIKNGLHKSPCWFLKKIISQKEKDTQCLTYIWLWPILTRLT